MDLIEDTAGLASWIAAHPAAAVLDTRPAADFAERHLRGATSLPGLAAVAHDPAALASLLPSIFLPPRHRPLLVLGASSGEAISLARALAARGRARLAVAAPGPGALRDLPEALLGRGPSDRPLWEAPRWLVAHAGLLPPPALGPALDLGCGSGRAAVWLASRGYRVTGLDHQPEALELMARLADSRGVRVQGLRSDLRAAGGVPPGPWGVLVVIRCLHRPLLQRLHELVAPHGVAVVRSFRDAPGWAPDITAPHRLRPAELARSFPAGWWEVLAHEEGFDDDGRPAAGIVARRRGGR